MGAVRPTCAPEFPGGGAGQGMASSTKVAPASTTPARPRRPLLTRFERCLKMLIPSLRAAAAEHPTGEPVVWPLVMQEPAGPARMRMRAILGRRPATHWRREGALAPRTERWSHLANHPSAEGEAGDDWEVVRRGLVAALGRILGDRGSFARPGVDPLDPLDERVADKDVVDQLAAATEHAAEATLLVISGRANL